jgi:L-threonylcarbamoyladenylate synthase
MQKDIWNDENLIKVLIKNGIVIMPTDTIYGLVGKALEKSTVERIYNIKKRNPDKPCIILINNIKELEKFSIIPSREQREAIIKYWPGPVSIVLDCLNDKFIYLHRGTKTLSFRLPYSESLRNLLMKTGPLIAPSANPENFPPAKNVEEAKKYFGDSIDLYVDGGELKNKASKLIKLNNDDSITVLRE